MERDEMIARFSPNQDEIYKKVAGQMKEVKCFECEGVIFKGDRSQAALLFAHNNPTGGDFYVWLQDNYQIVAAI